MRAIPVAFAAAAVLAAALAGAAAQQATERFIPIGQSPGASNRTTVIGRLDAIEPGRRTLTVTSDAASRPAIVDNRTRIWLDRSKLGRQNVPATLADLKPGSRVEVKFADPAANVAEWIKVEAAN
jgi:hypothetical protein